MIRKFILPILCLFSGISFAQYEAEFQARKDVLYEIITNKYYCFNSGAGFQPCSSRPPGYFDIDSDDALQYMAPKMLVIYEKEGISGTPNSDLVNERMTNKMITYGLFHFNYPGLTKLLMEYPNAPGNLATKKAWLTKMFNRTDSYNAFTCEGTENHLMMSRLPAYVLCELAIDSFPTDFPQAAARRDSLKNYIMTISKKMYSAGVAEFNSATYEAFSVAGWVVLYDYAKDPEVKAAAKAALDYYALEVALHHSQGIAAGGDMRGKGVTSSMSIESSLAWLGWIWYGESTRDPYNVSSNFNKPTFVQCYYAAASSYRPPSVAVKLAKKQLTKPAMYYNSKGSYLLDNPSYIKQTMYLDSNFALGATYFPYGGWASGDWQMVNWKLISRVDSGASKSVQYVSGQGMQYFQGGNYRTPFDQFAHHKNVLIQLTRVPSNAATIKSNMQTLFNTWAASWDTDFGQRFSLTDTRIATVNSGIAVSGRKTPIGFQNPTVTSGNSFMDILANGTTYTTATGTNIFFVELEKTYLAIRTIKNVLPANASGQLTDASSIGSMSGFVLEVRNKSDFSSFANFQSVMTANTSLDKSKVDSEKRVIYTSSLGDVINMQYQSAGTFTEPIYDWGYGVTSPKVIHSEPPFTQPTWPTGEGHGKIARWTVNGNLVDLSQTWGVYEGPHAVIKNNILVLNDSAGTEYKVDYTGSAPVFTELLASTENSEPAAAALSQQITLYPNPTTGTVNIAFRVQVANASIQVYLITGELVQEISVNKPLTSTQIDLPKSGSMCIIKILTPQSSTSHKVLLK